MYTHTVNVNHYPLLTTLTHTSTAIDSLLLKIRIHMTAYIYIFICLYMHKCIDVYLHTCIYPSIYIYIHIFISIYMYV